MTDQELLPPLDEEIDLDVAYQKMGGFGCSQKLTTLFLCVLRNSGLAFIYMFGLLTMKQQFLCRTNSTDEFAQCSAEETICPRLNQGQFVEYKVDTSYEYYLNNWYVEMDFVCAETTKIDLMASIYMIGVGIGAFTLSWLPDKHGRRMTLLLTGTLHIGV